MEVNSSQVNDVVKKLVTEILNRLKQEFLGEAEELQTRSVRKFSGTVSRNAWKSIQKWCVFSNDGPITFPDHVRLYYRKGSTEVLVQEFPPQMRFMRLHGSLAKRNTKEDDLPPGLEREVFTYSLALPYLVFIYKFVDGLFKEVYLTFSDRPLKNLKEKPLIPYLSNIDQNLKVCLGNDFDQKALIQGELNQQVALVLSHFWQSIYSKEWDSNYWKMKEHFAADPRLNTLENWQAASMEDPLFVVDDVNWLKFNDDNYGDILVRLLETDKVDEKFQNSLSQDLIDAFLEESGENIQQTIKKIIAKMEANDIGKIAEILLTEFRNLGIKC